MTAGAGLGRFAAGAAKGDATSAGACRSFASLVTPARRSISMQNQGGGYAMVWMAVALGLRYRGRWIVNQLRLDEDQSRDASALRSGEATVDDSLRFKRLAGRSNASGGRTPSRSQALTAGAIVCREMHRCIQAEAAFARLNANSATGFPGPRSADLPAASGCRNETLLSELALIRQPRRRVGSKLEAAKQIRETRSDRSGTLAQSLQVLSLPQLDLREDTPSRFGIGKRPPALKPDTQ